VVELWTLPAEELLVANDLGLIPWVPLTYFDGPPEPILERCRERIDKQAPPAERTNLLAVTQILARLRYNDTQLLAILGGTQIMIESPLIQELMAQRDQRAILKFLETRFGAIPPEVAARLRGVLDEQKLDELIQFAAACPDLESFRVRLAALLA
jgi:hypothetical protein